MLDRDQYVLLVEIEYRTYTFCVLFTVVPNGRTERRDRTDGRTNSNPIWLRYDVTGISRTRTFTGVR